MNESYKQDLNNVNDDYIIDKELSNDRVKVYQEKRNPQNAVIVHRGSYDTQDWLDNRKSLGLNGTSARLSGTSGRIVFTFTGY